MAEWLQTAAGQQYVLGIAGTLGALVLFFIVVFLLRKRKGGTVRRGTQDSTRRNRLSVIEISHLDDQRSFVLMRRDDVEHLVLVGGANDLVVESGIDRAGHARRAQSQPVQAAPAPAPAPLREPVPVRPAQPPVAAAPIAAPTPLSGTEPRRNPEVPARVEPASALASAHPMGETVPVSAAPQRDPQPDELAPALSPAQGASGRLSELSLDFAPVPLSEPAQKAEPQSSQPATGPASDRDAIDAEMQRFLDDLAKGRN
ncbi:flagellar biosynthetic protein FliO [Limoniibacter endophyticus]|uniref:Flagellar biosynthesis protein FliO n=1 Tax=Limoniibacter endophyticus TaxID=1565040 RepID=A0A8J3GFT2_9HYPH|nr:flagellar biosynthetic protein FliO [Limoniibacter endophyticus]GHC60526.1 hypothetical protein GCM10010136_00620 [Limoniibacter endophyticus]